MAVIEATAILHNISLEWGDIMQRNMYDDAPPALFPQDPDEEELVVINDVPAGERREQGLEAREGLLRMCLEQPTTAAEIARIAELNNNQQQQQS